VTKTERPSPILLGALAVCVLIAALVYLKPLLGSSDDFNDASFDAEFLPAPADPLVDTIPWVMPDQPRNPFQPYVEDGPPPDLASVFADQDG
jgi:hypothetical protein